MSRLKEVDFVIAKQVQKIGVMEWPGDGIMEWWNNGVMEIKDSVPVTGIA